MDNFTDQIESSALLMLNDHCLLAIFKYLAMDDYINIAKTCSRLKAAASRYKNICVLQASEDDAVRPLQKWVITELVDRANNKIKLILLNFLSALGEHILSVKVIGRELVFLQMLTDNCSNLSIVNVDSYDGPLPFQNLKELKLGVDVTITTKQLKRCFKNNPDIEVLEYNGACDSNFVTLLKMLPKLKDLQIRHTQRSPRLNQQFLNLLLSANTLTAFSFRSDSNRNEFLIELGKQLNLLELKVYMPCDVDTFDILRLFRNLERLSMNLDEGFVRILETTELPLMLMYVRFDNIKISCSRFLSFINQTKFLKEFDLGSTGRIYSDSEKCKLLYQNS